VHVLAGVPLRTGGRVIGCVRLHHAVGQLHLGRSRRDDLGVHLEGPHDVDALIPGLEDRVDHRGQRVAAEQAHQVGRLGVGRVERREVGVVRRLVRLDRLLLGRRFRGGGRLVVSGRGRGRGLVRRVVVATATCQEGERQ
jgi:hypothetical protein